MSNNEAFAHYTAYVKVHDHTAKSRKQAAQWLATLASFFITRHLNKVKRRQVFVKVMNFNPVPLSRHV